VAWGWTELVKNGAPVELFRLMPILLYMLQRKEWVTENECWVGDSLSLKKNLISPLVPRGVAWLWFWNIPGQVTEKSRRACLCNCILVYDAN
jgi:hypothetical protein